jgi:hypothetical protein
MKTCHWANHKIGSTCPREEGKWQLHLDSSTLPEKNIYSLCNYNNDKTPTLASCKMNGVPEPIVSTVGVIVRGGLGVERLMKLLML